MTSRGAGGSPGEPPALERRELLHVFLPGRIEGPRRIVPGAPLPGVLVRDRTGAWFLSPEEDEGGGGMRAVLVVDPPDEARRLVGRPVCVTGRLDAEVRLRLSGAAASESPSDSA